MATNYIVSAQKATVISHAVVGNFLGTDAVSLVIAKTNRIELLLVTSEGLKAYREVPIFGRIATIKGFRAQGEVEDSLLILTCKYHLAIIRWNAHGELMTRASGHIADRVGRPSETGMIACVHHSGLIAFRLYDGLLKIVKWSEGKEIRGINFRCDDLYIIDIDFLADFEPTLAYIYQDQNGRHLKVVAINFDDKELSPPLWKQDNIESEAAMLIPIPNPFFGLVVVGQESISYHRDASTFLAIAPPLIHQAQISCYGKVDNDGQRYLLGDLSGRIFMLLLELGITPEGESSVKTLKVELLGETSIPECIVYLDNGVVFVGSRFGDSVLIRLTTQPCDDNSFISYMESFTNLAPIRDMVVISQDGQQQVITCSGCFKDGSLRIIRSGIGIEELASVELPGIKSLFTLNSESELDDYLVVGFPEETHFMKIVNEELDDTPLSGFRMDEPTLWAGRLGHGGIAQVTPTAVIMVKGEKVHSWDPPSRISVVSANERSGQIIVACGNVLCYLKLTESIELVATTESEYEIACTDISPIDDNVESNLFAVGYWTDMSVAIRSLPDLREVVKQKIAGEMLARSMLIYSVEDIVYLLVALGDGTLHYFQIDMTTGALIEPKKATLGTQPTTLKKFTSRGMRNVFACSDRPAVIYSSNQKLVFSNVNLKLVANMSPLNSAAYQDCLVMSDGQALVVGKIDDIQKLHIRTVPLGESPTRIAYQQETNTLAVLVQRTEVVEADGSRHGRGCASKVAMNTSCSQPSAVSRTTPTSDSDEIEVSSVILLDANTFEVLHSHELGKNELALSVKSCTLGDDPQTYYAVGTGLVYNDETEARMGRILIFQVSNAADGGRMRLIHEKEMKGAAYSIQTLMGKLVVAINSCVRLFEWTSDKELRLECSDFENVVALYLRTKGDLVLVGDLMRSVSLLSYKSVESSFEKVARDYVTNWMTACEIIDAETFLGAENSFNLFTVVRDNNASNTEESSRLQETGTFHLGEMVNVFCHGSLIPNHMETTPPYSTPILYGTSDGGLGIIVQLSAPFFAFVHDLEVRIAAMTVNCMRVDHAQYRSFETEKRNELPSGFIDGDLVESILDMSRDTIEGVVEGLKMPLEAGKEQENATVEEVLKVVEDLARIH